jgi:hypothetical protein
MMSEMLIFKVKKVLVAGVFAAALATGLGFTAPGTAAAAVSRLWSVAVHIEYQDGSVYEHVFVSGVPTAELPSYLAACGQSHAGGEAVRIHCFPIPE